MSCTLNASIAAGEIDTTAWIGVCLHDVASGACVLSAKRNSRDFSTWQGLTVTADQLAKLNQTHVYTLDLLVPFCLPFGANGASHNNETHPPHGEPAGGTWHSVNKKATG